MKPQLSNTEADDTGASIQAVCKKLDHVIGYLKILGQVTNPNIQHAIRIIQSRKRELHRIWDSRYGGVFAMTKARIELSVAKRDMGQLVVIGEKKHGVGRLDCRACATAIVSTVSSLFPMPLSRLCNHCSSGIQHAYEIEDFTPAVEPGGPNPSDQPAQRAVEVANGPQDLQILVDQPITPGILRVERHFHCDNCGAHDVEIL